MNDHYFRSRAARSVIVVLDSVAAGAVVFDVAARVNTEGDAAHWPKHKEQHKAPEPLNPASLTDCNGSGTLRANGTTRSPLLINIDVVDHLSRGLSCLWRGRVLDDG
jgi:hypothetical protein